MSDESIKLNKLYTLLEELCTCIINSTNDIETIKKDIKNKEEELVNLKNIKETLEETLENSINEKNITKKQIVNGNKKLYKIQNEKSKKLAIKHTELTNLLNNDKDTDIDSLKIQFGSEESTYCNNLILHMEKFKNDKWYDIILFTLSYTRFNDTKKTLNFVNSIPNMNCFRVYRQQLTNWLQSKQDKLLYSLNNETMFVNFMLDFRNMYNVCINKPHISMEQFLTMYNLKF